MRGLNQVPRRLVRAGLLTRPSYAADGLPFPGRRRVTWRPSAGQTAVGRPSPTKRRTAGPEDARRTIQIRNESSRDQRAVKTNFAACHDRTDYPRPRILSMHAENAMMAPRRRNQSTLIYNVFASTGRLQSLAVSGVEFLGVASGGSRLGGKGPGRYNSPAAEPDCRTPTRWPPMSWRRFSRNPRGACLAAGLMVSGLAASLG